MNFIHPIKHNRPNRSKHLFRYHIIRSVVLLIFTIPLSGNQIVSENHLFFISRNKDTNTINYEVNIDERGRLQNSNPINIYWLKVDERKRKEALTRIQSRFGYGLVFQEIMDYSAKFHFAAYPERIFELRQNKEKEYRIYSISNHQTVEIKQIHLHFTGGSFWLPEITQVDIFANLPGKNEVFVEIIHL